MRGQATAVLCLLPRVRVCVGGKGGLSLCLSTYLHDSVTPFNFEKFGFLCAEHIKLVSIISQCRMRGGNNMATEG